MDRYTIVRSIGKGSFGEVSICTRKKDGMSFVMKVISTSSLSEDKIDSVVKEVKLLASLQHPYIVQYVDCFYFEDNFCIVMEHCSGGDLAEKLSFMNKNQSYANESDAWIWFHQLSCALEHCHDNSILHRDLKPSNVFIGSSNVLKIGDFGASKLVVKDSLASTVIGTPYSLAPELCKSEPYSFSSDIWGLGCIFFEILSLKRPFNGLNLLDLVWHIVQDDVPALPNQYSGDIVELIKNMLNKDPALRPSIKHVKSVCQSHIVSASNEIKESSSNETVAAPSRVAVISTSFSNLRKSRESIPELSNNFAAALSEKLDSQETTKNVLHKQNRIFTFFKDVLPDDDCEEDNPEKVGNSVLSSDVNNFSSRLSNAGSDPRPVLSRKSSICQSVCHVNDLCKESPSNVRDSSDLSNPHRRPSIIRLLSSVSPLPELSKDSPVTSRESFTLDNGKKPVISRRPSCNTLIDVQQQVDLFSPENKKPPIIRKPSGSLSDVARESPKDLFSPENKKTTIIRKLSNQPVSDNSSNGDSTPVNIKKPPIVRKMSASSILTIAPDGLKDVNFNYGEFLSPDNSKRPPMLRKMSGATLEIPSSENEKKNMSFGIISPAQLSPNISSIGKNVKNIVSQNTEKFSDQEFAELERSHAQIMKFAPSS